MIIDNNFISQEQAEVVKNTMLSFDFPWSFNPSTVYSNDKKLKDFHQFNHIFLNENISSEYLEICKRVFYTFCKKNNIEVKRIIKAKANFTSSNGKKEIILPPHIDQLVKHRVFLYYVNDSDGDTIIYNEKFGDTFSSHTEKERISPEMGKGMVFDGAYYHSPILPYLSNYRLVINVDFE